MRAMLRFLREGVRRAVVYAEREAVPELHRQAQQVQELLEAGGNPDDG